MLEGHHSLLVQVAIVLNLTVKHVTSGTLHSKVELVLPKPGSSLSHPVVGPASILRSVQHVVVLDGGEALLQDRSIEQRVKGVT